MKFRRSKPVNYQPTHQEPPVGWHEGRLSSIQILRRHGRHVGERYYPSGWDLVDTQSKQVIAEFNDETAPPAFRPKIGQPASLQPQDGNELGEMFKQIYQICYDTTIEAMKLMGRAMPEHADSNDGEPIAQIVIGAYSRLPETIKMTKREAYNATQPF
jgi:hypothetical protein